MVTSVSGSSSLSQLFSKIDSKSQGYIEKSDLASIFQSISGSGDDSSVEDLFSMLDSDSDGKVTEREFSTTLSKLQQQLEDQFGQMRMQQGMQGMPPPPPPQNDEGFTQDELQAQLEEIGDTDSQRASLISNIVSNFEAADSDGDGKVSFAEAMAYDKSQQGGGSDSATTSASTTASGESSQYDAVSRILQLLQAYSRPDDSNISSLLDTLA